MRIMSVIHGPVFGGAHNQLARLHDPLLKRGFETIAVLPEEATAAANRLANVGVEVLQLPLGRLRATMDPRTQVRFALNLRRDITRLRDAVRELNADVVQVHGATNPQGALAARTTGAAIVWQLFDTRAPMALRRAAVPMIVRLTDAMTVWGRALVRLHPGVEGLGERIVVVFPPVALDQWTPTPDRIARARAALRAPEGAPVIGTLGVLNPQKGHEHLLRAVALLRRRHPDLRVRILGAASPAHGAYERGLHALAKELDLAGEDRLMIVDPGHAACDLVHAFDIFVMSSVPRSEGMPTAILEAMAAGKPVISTRVGAVDELVEDRATGLLVEPDAPAALARAADVLLADPALRRRLADAASRRAQREFDLDRLADLHARAYRIALHHRRQRT